ncbi:MAG: Na/Pi cotransporter family protein [Ruminococcaceae bacterium]|nr:Na/Pi cotransporter family protein [Oscillospiraceae bacterium]
MSIINIIMLFGGLAFFLYGMNVMSSGLEKMAGGKLESALSKMTDNLFKSMLLGAGITIAIQSSSALTVMLVGLVNSGIMHFGKTIGVIMGSNIGTTLTAWITSLAGIESDNIWMSLLKPANFSLVFAFVGIIMIMLSKQQKKKDIGAILIGFAVLMAGMGLMGDAMEPLSEMPEFQEILVAFNNPILGVLVGAAFTGIIQSSAASVAILQSFAMAGGLSYGMAIPIIMGQNIGTCVTALISSIGVSKNAKKVAVVHISFNIIGTIICLVLFYIANSIFNFAFVNSDIDTFGIAMVHTIFNIATSLMLCPFCKQLEKLANFLIKVEPTEKEKTLGVLDDRLLTMPAFAISKCTAITIEMAQLANDNINRAISLMKHYDPKVVEKINATEELIDGYEDKLGNYLIKLSNANLTEDENWQVTKLLHTIGDFERIGDHAINLLDTAQELHDKNISFSAETTREIDVITEALTEILYLTTEAFSEGDIERAKLVEPLEEVIDELVLQARAKHTKRIQRGNSPMVLGFILTDLLTNYERVSDHCSNVAVVLIEIDSKQLGTHQYLDRLKSADNVAFADTYNEYLSRYQIHTEV